MCRNIKKLRRPERPPTDSELEEAALQFIRKISGYRAPSRANRVAFERAVRDVARASRRLFDRLATPPAPDATGGATLASQERGSLDIA